MSRRIFTICLVLGFLVFALAFLTAKPIRIAQAQALTATATLTGLSAEFTGSPLQSDSTPLMVYFTAPGSVGVKCTWTWGDGGSYTPEGICGFATVTHTYRNPGVYTVSLHVEGAPYDVTKTDYIVVLNGPTKTPTSCPCIPTPTRTPTPTAGQPDLLYPATPNWIWDPNAYDSANSCYNYVPVLVWNVQVKNGGSADAGSFVVSQNYDLQKSVSGLPAGQTTTLYFPFTGMPIATAAAGQPTLAPNYSNFIADYTNLVAESNETNNTTRSFIPMFTATPNGGPTRVFCKTPTPVITSTPTRTPTRTITLTPTRTPTGPTLTRTRTPTTGPSLTPTRTITPTTGLNLCTPTSTITAPFILDGVTGTFCWQSNNLGSYINSWNTTKVTLNFLDVTNIYVPASSYPSQINGYWYISYTSALAYGHFETK